MLGRTAHHDLIRFSRHPQDRITGKVFPKRHIGIKCGAGLVKHSDIKVCAKLDAAFVWFNFAQQHIENSGFTDAVGTNKRDPVTALYGHVKAAHYLLAVIGFSQGRCLNHLFAGCRAAVKGHSRGALPFDLPRLFGTQFGQRTHASLVAFAACGNTFDGPTRLCLDLAVQLVALLVFFFPQLVAPFLEPVKTLFGAAHLATVNPQGGTGQIAQECTVVADQHKCGACGF